MSIWKTSNRIQSLLNILGFEEMDGEFFHRKEKLVVRLSSWWVRMTGQGKYSVEIMRQNRSVNVSEDDLCILLRRVAPDIFTENSSCYCGDTTEILEDIWNVEASNEV